MELDWSLCLTEMMVMSLLEVIPSDSPWLMQTRGVRMDNKMKEQQTSFLASLKKNP